jgi:HSP90 family molecular chaperone
MYDIAIIGTIAKSGTRELREKLQQDMSDKSQWGEDHCC